MNEPMVSVCIPVYNGENSIANTIENVLFQSFTNFELIIINDDSEDRTEEIILSFKDRRLKYIKNLKNLGMVKNWNKAVSIAEGKYVKLLCMDDLVDLNCLEKQVQALENNPSAVMVTNNTRIIDKDNNLLMIRKNFVKEGLYNGAKVSKKSLVMGKNLFGEPSVVLYRREILKKIGLYDEDFWYIPDWDFCIRMLAFGDLYFIDKELASFRLSNKSQTSKIISNNKFIIMKEDIKFLYKHSNNVNLNKLDKFIHYIITIVFLISKYMYIKAISIKEEICNLKIVKFLNLNDKICVSDYLQFMKFFIAGVLNTIISILFYYIFLKIGVFYTIANTIAYIIGMINSYILSKRWVFDTNTVPKITMLKFMIVNLLLLASSNFLLYLMITGLSFNKTFAQLPVIFIILAINYTVNKAWTFRKRNFDNLEK